MILHLKIIGLILVVLSLAHAGFPKHFKWRDECGSLSLINRQMMYVHTFFLALALFLMGVLCLTSANEIVETELGKRLALGLGIFWGFRLLFQFFVYSSDNWRGKRFETAIHVLFSVVWTYIAAVFLLVYFA